jgi:hypothetical protein
VRAADVPPFALAVRGQDERALCACPEEVERQNGRAPGQMIVDEGYTTRENVLAADGPRGGPDRQQPGAEGRKRHVRKHFAKSGVDPAYLSRKLPLRPGERHLYLSCRVRSFRIAPPDAGRVGVVHQVYQARAADCRRLCAACGVPTGPARDAMIVRSENVPAVAAYVAKMQTEEARAAYRRRGAGGGI